MPAALLPATPHAEAALLARAHDPMYSPSVWHGVFFPASPTAHEDRFLSWSCFESLQIPTHPPTLAQIMRK